LEPHWNPAAFPPGQTAPVLIQDIGPMVGADLVEQSQFNEQVTIPKIKPAPGCWDASAKEIVRATRSWIQYGTVAFAVICIVIGAVEALLGR
jgi:hypothetical protein